MRKQRASGCSLRRAEPHRVWAATSSRFRNSTAPPTRCSLTFCPVRESPFALRRSDQPGDIENLIDEKRAAVFCETVGNPAGNICDIEALARVAHKYGVPLIVDNTVATPILLRPIEYGADIVVHSLTKFMGGHGTTLGGVIVDSGKFPWKEHAQRFPSSARPTLPITIWFIPIISRRPPILDVAAASTSGPRERCYRL